MPLKFFVDLKKKLETTNNVNTDNSLALSKTKKDM
jgi:hypothetical protein